MTVDQFSQATASSKRFYHQAQETFNQIQNSMVTLEIHDQGCYNRMRYNTSLIYWDLFTYKFKAKRHFVGLIRYRQ